MVETRRALPTDAESAVEVLRASITELCELDHQYDPPTLDWWLSNKTVAQFERWLADQQGCVIVALVDEAVVGVGALNQAGQVRLCYVKPNLTRIGVGRALIGALEAQARTWGIASLTLSSSLAARGFYERCGYTAAGSPVPAFGILRSYPFAKVLDLG